MFTIGQKCTCKIGRNEVKATITETSSHGPWLLKTTQSGKTIKVTDNSRITPLAEDTQPENTEQTNAPGSKNKYSLLDAAEIVLKTCPHQPLSAKAIIKLATQGGLWKPGAGKTPANTLHASINKEIKTKGEASRFSAQAKYGAHFC